MPHQSLSAHRFREIAAAPPAILELLRALAVEE
jgi:hypothetical protein